MRIQSVNRLLATLRPPAKPPLRQTLLAEPEALTIESETSQGLASLARKNKERSGHWIGVELLPTEGRKTIDAFTKVHRSERRSENGVNGAV